MSEPVISVGDPTTTKIPAGDSWTPLATGLLRPADGRTMVTGQLAVSLPTTVIQRPTLCEIQLVRLTPGMPENPTGQDDHQFTWTLVNGVPRVRVRQNWTYHDELRTYADEPLRIEARHPGPVTISLEWVVKLVLLRPEGSR